MPSILLDTRIELPEPALHYQHESEVLSLKVHLPNGFTLRIIATHELDPTPVSELCEEVAEVHTDHVGLNTVLRLVKDGLITNTDCAPDGHVVYRFV
jgi:hypothetical protein